MMMMMLFVSLVNNCSKIFSPSVYLAGGAGEAGGVEHGEGPQLGRHHGNTASGQRSIGAFPAKIFKFTQKYSAHLPAGTVL